MSSPAARLAAATRAHAEATSSLAAARKELWDAIRRARAAGMSQADIVRVTGYTRETIRRITLAVAPDNKVRGNGAAHHQQALREGEGR